MRTILSLAALAVLPFLAGCLAGSTPSDDGDLQLKVQVPPAAKAPCNEVVDIPDRALQSAEAAELWGRDRASLGDCAAKNRLLVKIVNVVEAP